MDARVQDLVARGDRAFSKRSPVLSVWQTQADNFYPERADFTRTFSLGEEFASYLMTGFPVLCRRDLANSLAAMLRPAGQEWFHPKTDSEAVNKDPAAKRWLEEKAGVMRRMMYDRRSQLVYAAKAIDNDFVTFGNAVGKVEWSDRGNYLLAECRHPRDVVWCQNYEQAIDEIHDKYKLQARQLVQKFGDKVAKEVKDLKGPDIYRDITCRRIILPSDDYDQPAMADGSGLRKRKLPFVSITVDVEHGTVLDETPIWENPYFVPRWMRWPGMEIGTSPATVIALPDARMIQQMLLTMLEAGQKAVDPPMKVVGEMIQGGLNFFAGGATVVEADYDEHTGKIIEPIMSTMPDLSWGTDREDRIQKAIRSAFMLDQIRVPGMDGKAMTATQFRGMYEEYVRQNLPLFEPVESDYSAALCDKVFTMALRRGAFGSFFDMPQSLRARDITFDFDSPIKSASNTANAQKFQEGLGLLSQAMQLDPAMRYDVDLDKALRGAFDGIEMPADWIVDPDTAAKLKAADRQQQAADAATATVAKGADVAQRVGAAAQSLQGAGMVPGGEQVA